MLCPGQMHPPPKTTKDNLVDLLPSTNTNNNPSTDLIASADTLPGYSPPYGAGLPFIGMYISLMWNATRYASTLEKCADFIAADFERGGESAFVGKRVGVVERGRCAKGGRGE